MERGMEPGFDQYYIPPSTANFGRPQENVANWDSRPWGARGGALLSFVWAAREFRQGHPIRGLASLGLGVFLGYRSLIESDDLKREDPVQFQQQQGEISKTDSLVSFGSLVLLATIETIAEGRRFLKKLTASLPGKKAPQAAPEPFDWEYDEEVPDFRMTDAVFASGIIAYGIAHHLVTDALRSVKRLLAGQEVFHVYPKDPLSD